MILIVPLCSAVKVPGQKVWMGQYIALVFFLFGGISVFLWHYNKFLSIFTGVCLLSTFFVAGLTNGSVLLLLQLDLLCLLSYGVSKFNKTHRKYIRWSILALVLFQFFWLCLQKFHLDPIFYLKGNRALDDMVAFAGSPDHMGSFFAITSPIMIGINPLLSILSFTAIAFSKSSFAFVSAVIACLIYVSYMYKHLMPFFLAFIVIAGIIFFVKFEKLSQADFGIRFKVWKHATDITIKGKTRITKNGKTGTIQCNPIFGYGFGNFNQIFPFIPQYDTPDNEINCNTEKFDHAHNDYVETFIFELGYIGVLVGLLLIGHFFWGFAVASKTAELVLYFSSVLAYLLNATGNFVSHIAPSGMLLAVFYGLYMGTKKEIYGTQDWARG